MKKLVIVAGDKSGDLYGGMLSKRLKEKYSSLDIFSFGGNELAQYSHQIADFISQSVSGIYEVLSHLHKFIKIFNDTLRYIESLKPDLIILIDFPDFNLRLAKKINKRYPVFYYVSPQIWAWREKRITIIRKYVEKMIVIFNFEKEFYENAGIDAFYFGHPLLEIINNAHFSPSSKIIAFMPGSRRNELKYHLPLLKETHKILKKNLKEYSFRIIKPDNIEESYYKKYFSHIPVMRHSYKTIGESKFIISSSGTATVEIAILGIPHLIIYKVNPLSWYILKSLVKTKYAGMANILSSKMAVEELLQENATPEKIAGSVISYINDKEKYNAAKAALNNIKTMLEPPNAVSKFAEYIGKYLKLT